MRTSFLKHSYQLKGGLLDALKREKENNKFFHCNDIAQIIRHHSFSTYGNVTQKLTFLPPDTYRWGW